MVGAGAFSANVALAAEALKSVGLLDDQRQWVAYPPELPGKVRKLTYVEEYRLYRNEGLYDFLLADNAILQFKRYDDGNLSYCYYQSPYDAPTYEEFVASIFGDEAINLDEVGDIFRDEYDIATATANLRSSATPIRFDFDPEHYRPCCHPAAHIHIGASNPIRLCTRRLMLPLAFSMFVVRQMYPDRWRAYIDAGHAASIRRAIRDDLESIDDSYHSDDDRLQLILE